MSNAIIKSLDGHHEPERGQVCVYWKQQDFTDVFTADGFSINAYEKPLTEELCEVTFYGE